MNSPEPIVSDKSEKDAICAEIAADRIAHSTALSTQSRTIALAVLALAWLLLNGTQQSLTIKFKSAEDSLLWIALLCVGSLLADFMQNAAALVEAHGALKASRDATRAEDAGYDEGHWLRYTSDVFFITKIVLAFIASFWSLSIILGLI